VSEVDGILVAEPDSSLRGELRQHSTLARRSPKRVIREARPDQPAGHASGGSSLLLPWLGSIGVWGGSSREAQYSNLGQESLRIKDQIILIRG